MVDRGRALLIIAIVAGSVAAGIGIYYFVSQEGGTGTVRSVAVDGDSIYVAGYRTRSSGWDGLLLKYSSAGSLLWSRTMRGNNRVMFHGVDADAGYIYVVGSCKSAETDGIDGLLVKYDSSGTLLWTRTWGGPETDSFYDVVVDGSVVYLTGFNESAERDRSATIVKYDTSGDFIWGRAESGEYDIYGYGIAVDSSHNVYIAGEIEEYSTFKDILIARYSSTGNNAWTETWNNPGFHMETGTDICIDESDNLYVSGWNMSDDATDFDGLLLQYDTSGNWQWTRVWDNSSKDLFLGVTANGSVIYAAGKAINSDPGYPDGLLVKYNPSGDEAWARSSESCHNFYKCAAGEGEVYVIGLGKSGSSTKLLKYSSAGTELWCQGWG